MTKQWENQVLSFHGSLPDNKSVLDTINEHGDQGWKQVSMIFVPAKLVADSVVFVSLRRKKKSVKKKQKK
jgi:hypothetical protein